MAEILLPRKLKGQPQYNVPIDREGLGKGIQLLFNPALGPIDLATGRVWSAGNLAAITTSEKGKCFTFSNGGDYYGYTGYDEITSNVGTFFMWMPVVGATDSFGHVFLGASTPNVSGHQIYPDLTISIGSNSPGTGTISSWFNTTNRSLVLVSGGTGSTCKAYLDGIDSGITWATDPVAYGAGAKNFNFGRYVGAGGFQVFGSMTSMGNTSALWGAAEARAYHESQGNVLYKAKPRRFWAVITGGPLVGASLTADSSLATGAVSQVHILTAAGLTQANDLATGAVTQGGVLIGTSLSIANALGTGSVSQTHILTGAGGSVAESLATGSVGQIHILTGTGLDIAITLGTGELASDVLIGTGLTLECTLGSSAITMEFNSTWTKDNSTSGGWTLESANSNTWST